jgi:hypothetical protein
MERPATPNPYSNKTSFDWQYVFDLNRYIDYLERQQKLTVLRTLLDDDDAVLCACIDKCSSKRKTYYCHAQRSCVHKLKKL